MAHTHNQTRHGRHGADSADQHPALVELAKKHGHVPHKRPRPHNPYGPIVRLPGSDPR